MRAAWGVRSTSSADARYTLTDMIVPYSNWRGPVWINVNVVLAYTLAGAGRRADALALARALTLLLANDIRATGGMHECYDGDSGAPLASASLNFLSWNVLVATLHDNLTAGVDPFAGVTGA
jgi:glycogen debranching enzyme